MDITITINTDNAAFEDDPGAEVARILKRLAQKIEVYGIEVLPPERAPALNLFDSNGNTVGKCETSE